MERVLGLDFGEKRIGVAISDPMGWTAQGIERIERTDNDSWMERLHHIVREYEVTSIVVGLPRNMDGTIGERGRLCQDVAKQLEGRFGLPVYLWDERLSTAAVERTLIAADLSRKKRKKVVDQLAASWILQGYLDAQARGQRKE
jgi:putative Holliday junction resolvase